MNKFLTVVLALCLCATARADVIKETVSSFSDVQTTFTIQKHHNIEIFGTLEKTSTLPDCSTIISRSRLYPNLALPFELAHNRPIHDNRLLKVLDVLPSSVNQSSYKRVWFATNEHFVLATYCLILTDTFAMEWIVSDTDRVLYANSVQIDEVPPTSFLTFTDDPYPGTPGPSEPNGWQQYNNPDRIQLIDQHSSYSPIGWVFTNSLEGNNCKHICWTDKQNKFVWFDQTRRFEYPIDFGSDVVNSIGGISTAGFALYNYYHDYLYRYGFTEADGNFQATNLTGKGLGGDSINMVSYFGDGGNNAFFQGNGTDGAPAAITMLPFDNVFGSPNRHSAISQQVLWHEATHGTSVRLIGELASMQSRGMGEGWSDFVAMLMGSGPEDNPDLNYGMGGWIMWGFKACFTDNYYFGVRRYPLTTNETKNPLTLGDLSTETYSVDPTIPQSCIQWSNFEVHSYGEIWSVALWECYDVMYQRYGFEEGKDRMMTLVVEGMKLCPLSPTFLEARNSLLLADRLIYDDADRVALWARFAKRGYGVDATVPKSGNTEGVLEDFTEPDWSDYDQGGTKDMFDFLAFNQDFIDGSYRADLNSDDQIDLSDFLMFVNLFNQ